MQTVKNKLVTLKSKLEEATKNAEEAEDELAAVNAKAEALENEAQEKTAELNNLEDELDAAESKLASNFEQLGSAEKGSEEGLQVCTTPHFCQNGNIFVLLILNLAILKSFPPHPFSNCFKSKS